MSYLFQQFDWLCGYRKCKAGHIPGRDELGYREKPMAMLIKR
ncbi:MAG TPA: hypothetical protein VIT88_12185 [Pyrinomonadaceae bacterium]